MKTDIKKLQSFCCGYVAVKSGKITQELTGKEISEQFPKISHPAAFANGIIDALKNDRSRYRLCQLALEDYGYFRVERGEEKKL